MKGAGHPVTGATAWVAPTGPAAQLTGLAADPDVVPLSARTTAGSALISDWDHPRATITHTLPPVTDIIAPGRPRIAGGHRNGTHSLPGMGAFTLLAVTALPLQPN